MSITPKVITFDDAVDAYLLHRGTGRGAEFKKIVRIAQRRMFEAAGNKDVKLYDRDDARALIRYLEGNGAKSLTIRRRIGTIRAIFEHAYIEQEIEKRNPFSRLTIPGEGQDTKKRGTFTEDQLKEVYRIALGSGSEIKLIVPLLGETGCRLAEIVGLRLRDVDMDIGTITITPHPARRLKTRGSERQLPLVGVALEAMRQILDKRTKDDVLLFPRYERGGLILATHASNAVNRWLKRDFEGLTCHCLRHTMRDRLRAVEAPFELIDQIGGWASVGSVGASYGRGYKTEVLRCWLEKIAVAEIG
jgi:integrase